MKTRDIKFDLNVEGKIFPDTISKRNGVYIIRKGFYYKFGGSSQDLVDGVLRTFPNAKIIGHGTHLSDFKGGASVAKSSHWYVQFIIEEN